MDRVFLDANVLLSAAWKPGANLARLWELADVELVTSAYALDEARRNLPREDQTVRLDQLMASVRLVDPPAGRPLPEGIELPAKDAPILLAAIGAAATHLLSGDYRH